MKKIVLLFLIISNYAYASFPEDLYGLKLGMDRHAAEMIMSKNELKKCNSTHNSSNTSCYSGENLQNMGIKFNEVNIIYDNNNLINGIVFKLFIPQDEGTQRRIFRHLYDEIKPYAKSIKDENIRFNYLIKLRDKKENQYIRLCIKEVLQGNVGYYIFLTNCTSEKRLDTDY